MTDGEFFKGLSLEANNGEKLGTATNFPDMIPTNDYRMLNGMKMLAF